MHIVPLVLFHLVFYFIFFMPGFFIFTLSLNLFQVTRFITASFVPRLRRLSSRIISNSIFPDLKVYSVLLLHTKPKTRKTIPPPFFELHEEIFIIQYIILLYSHLCENCLSALLILIYTLFSKLSVLYTV